jgi:hypothetical protein
MALSANRDLDRMTDNELMAFPVDASKHIYKGALTVITASGYLAPCSAASGADFAGFGGVAYEEVDNSSGAAGAKNCRVWGPDVLLEIPASAAGSAVQANVGSPAFAANDTGWHTASANSVYIGRLQSVGATGKMFVSTAPIWADRQKA